MCKFCEENFEIKTTFGTENMTVALDEEQKILMKLRTVQDGVYLTKPIIIAYCPFCGKAL